jgi:RES domain-containing protein
MSAPLHRHPRFAELRDEFRNHADWFTPWTGTLFRFQTLDFPASKDVLNGRGAAWRGGRWNPTGLATVYGSTTDATALEECKANDRYYGIVTKGPRILVAIEANLSRILDLTNADIRRALDITLSELAAEDWRKLQAAGKESLAQVLGRAVAESGGSGLLSRSAAAHRGMNVAIFPGVCHSDRMTVMEADKLDKLVGRKKIRHLQ